MAALRIGSSSWKYDSWEGLVYALGEPATAGEPGARAESYLAQYARSFDTVEIDQWFWSLFESPVPRLPEPATAEQYAASVPEGFRFTVKVPNSITLTHHYDKARQAPPRPNPHFLDRQLFAAFLQRIQALHSRVGALIFQFEYLNRQKMASQAEFQERLGRFAAEAACPLPCALEVRNPAWLNPGLFRFLRGCGWAPCLLQGYYMPDLRQVFRDHEPDIVDSARRARGGGLVLRLHGPDRKGIEESSGGRWDRVIAPKDQEIEELGGVIAGLLARGLDVYVNVNNHYEGSAPLSIAKIRAAIQARAGSQSQPPDP